MDEILLVKPDETHEAEAVAFAKEFAERGETAYGSNRIEQMTSYADWLRRCRQNEREETAQSGRVPNEQFFAVRASDGKIVGAVAVRKRLTEQLIRLIGHVGYSVPFSQRRKGYATQILTQVVHYLHECGIDEVLVMCDETNIASRKTIERCGGRFLNAVDDKGTNVLRYAIICGEK